MFERLELLIGDKLDLIKEKNVLVLGLGGVGCYAVEALIRSGISNITVVDNDIIDITNLNRQLITNQDNIGKYKTDEIEKRILSINPSVKVTKINKFIKKENINELFNNNYNYVIDACDTITTKYELIKLSKKLNFKLISSMGTGNKMDPTRLQIIDIRKTNYDKIAKILRKKIKENRIKGKIMVVSSNEKTYVKAKDKIPSNSFVPAAAGLLCASYVINDIVGEDNV